MYLKKQFSLAPVTASPLFQRRMAKARYPEDTAHPGQTQHMQGLPTPTLPLGGDEKVRSPLKSPYDRLAQGVEAILISPDKRPNGAPTRVSSRCDSGQFVPLAQRPLVVQYFPVIRQLYYGGSSGDFGVDQLGARHSVWGAPYYNGVNYMVTIIGPQGQLGSLPFVP